MERPVSFSAEDIRDEKVGYVILAPLYMDNLSTRYRN